MDKPAKTPAQRRRFLKRRNITIAPSPEYLEIAEIVACDEYPSAALFHRFLLNDPIVGYVTGRVIDYVLWRAQQGDPVRERIWQEEFCMELQAAHDAAMTEMEARWVVGEGRLPSDGLLLALHDTFRRRR